MNYLDNSLVCASSADQCCSHVNLLVSHIQALGLCLNPYKCRLEPSQTTVFLVMSLDSVRASVSLKVEWQRVLRASLDHFTLHSRVTWGLCLRLMGLMAATVQVVPLAFLHKTSPAWSAKSRSASTALPPDHSGGFPGFHQALCWWSDPSNLQQGQCRDLVIHRLVSSDTSPVG